MRKWDILLVGGSSAVGKSYLARQLSKHFELPLMELDDIRIALQQVVDKNSHPGLFFFLNNSDYLEKYDTETLVQKLLGIGEEVWPALDKLIEKHLDCDEPVIIEGDSINPALLATNERPRVKAIFLWDSKENILERGRNRIRGNDYNPDLDDKQVDFSFAHGNELRKQAAENNFIVIPVSPIETLFDRTIELIDQ